MAASDLRSNTMAAEATAEIVSQKLEILLSSPEWIGCLGIETLARDAKANLARIQKFFSSRDRPLNSTEWTGRLLQALYHAEEFIDKFHLKVARGRHDAPQVATRPLAALVHQYMLWRDLSNLMKATKEFCQDQYLTGKQEAAAGAGGERKTEPVGSSSHASAPWEGQKLARLTNFWDRHASTNIMCHVKERACLKKRITGESKGLRGISIHGEQGAGKTFLARWAYREAMYMGFDTRAWVHVSTGMDTKEFLLEILKQVDKLAREVMDISEIRKMLSKILAKKGRFLIVLDDVRPSDEELLQGLLTTVPFSSQGRIITTTQDYKIAWTMNSFVVGPVIELKELNDVDSKKMLATKLHRGPHLPSLMPQESKIQGRVPALPLCISLLGRLLFYAEEYERAALEKEKTKKKKKKKKKEEEEIRGSSSLPIIGASIPTGGSHVMTREVLLRRILDDNLGALVHFDESKEKRIEGMGRERERGVWLKHGSMTEKHSERER